MDGIIRFGTYEDLIGYPTACFSLGQKGYCEETEKYYDFRGQEIGWIEISTESKYKGLEFDDWSIKMKREDGTVAFQIYIDENQEAKMVFYDKEGKAKGVLNSSVFD